jgi:predicted deacetylase
MIVQKLAIITIHDVNPSHSEKILKTLGELNKLKINYNVSIVPYYDKKYNLKDYTDFSNRISSTLLADNNNNNAELSLHGLYHWLDGKIEDFDTQSKEEEKQEIQEGLDILSAANLPRPSIFIPPSWHLSPQAIEALKELNFSISESMTHIEFIQKGKKYFILL